MRYFWLLDGKVQKLFSFQYHPGFENLADYPSKSHPGNHHLEVRPFYLHMLNSPRFLKRAARPSKRRGCVDQGKPTYYHRHLIPDLLRLTSIVDSSDMGPAAAAQIGAAPTLLINLVSSSFTILTTPISQGQLLHLLTKVAFLGFASLAVVKLEIWAENTRKYCQPPPQHLNYFGNAV